MEQSVCKKTLRWLGSFLSKCEISENEWTKSVKAIQSIIKDTPSRKLKNRAPINVHRYGG